MKASFFSARDFKRSDLIKFLSKCDILTIHCPLEKNTLNLITFKELKLMKKTSIIINTARGGIINEHDLVAAIKKNIIAGAGIDVATTEPPKKNHPYYNIIDKPNFIWTPHTAWASNATLNNAVNQLINNINSFYCNQPKNLV
jgi:glycerate dehydrogenase